MSIDPGDGYALLKSILPPPERRGIVLIDPAYELADEPVRLIDALRAAFARFRHGVYVVWYPPQATRRKRSEAPLCKLDPPKTLCINRAASVLPGAIASGVLIVNHRQARARLAHLTTFLGQSAADRNSAL